MTPLRLVARVAVPQAPQGAVLLVHAGAESRRPTTLVGDLLHQNGLATLVTDLLTPEESADGTSVSHERLAHRVMVALGWIEGDPRTRDLPIGAVAEGQGTAALLVACAHDQRALLAVACLAGRPDQVGPAIAQVRAPVLMLAADRDTQTVASARRALQTLQASELAVIDDTDDLASDPEALLAAAYRVNEWFVRHLSASPN